MVIILTKFQYGLQIRKAEIVYKRGAWIQIIFISRKKLTSNTKKTVRIVDLTLVVGATLFLGYCRTGAKPFPVTIVYQCEGKGFKILAKESEALTGATCENS